MTAKVALDRTVRLVRDAVLDTVSDETIVENLQSFWVKCIADEKNLTSHSGQSALVTLVSLLVRMGIQVVLDIPEVKLVGPQPPLRTSELRAALIDFGADIIPGTSVTYSPAAQCDIAFILGDTAAPMGLPCWRLTGSSWSANVTLGDSHSKRWNDHMPIGGMTAAVLAATEAFKAVVLRMPLRHGWDEFLKPCDQASFDFNGDGVALPQQAISVDFISAGAIIQAAVFVLYRIPIELNIRIFEHDVTEITNLNRQMLYRRSDSGTKVSLVTQATQLPNTCIAIPERFSQLQSVHHLPLAPYVMIGVDHIPSRWEAQRAATRWLGVGATSHFGVSTSSHASGEPCAGCMHPHDEELVGNEPIPTISFVSFWAGLSLAVRFLRQVGGKPHAPSQQQLWLASLRMDNKHGALWFPVAARVDCPVQCESSLLVLIGSQL